MATELQLNAIERKTLLKQSETLYKNSHCMPWQCVSVLHADNNDIAILAYDTFWHKYLVWLTYSVCCLLYFSSPACSFSGRDSKTAVSLSCYHCREDRPGEIL